jgi:intracellular multiplication protein IcmK
MSGLGKAYLGGLSAWLIVALLSSSPAGAEVASSSQIATPARASALAPDIPDKKSEASSISLDGPPPATAFSADPAELAKQAEDAAAQAAADEAKREADYNRKSFERAEKGLLPLTPDQIRDFMRRLEITQQASQPPAGGPPKAEVKIKTLSLDPGAEPPQISLVAGYVTTINMVDMSGEPWPILDVGIGGSFEVTPTQSGSHVIRIVPLARQAIGNLSVLLRDLPTPVIFRLKAGGDSVDMRYDARIPKMGPNGRAPIIDRGRHGPVAGDEAITTFLQNNPPASAKRMKVAGLDARTMAWQMDGKVYLRTPLQLLSPAWNASASSTDGMTVYEIGDAPVLLMSDNGAMVRAHLLQDEEHDNK